MKKLIYFGIPVPNKKQNSNDKYKIYNDLSKYFEAI